MLTSIYPCSISNALKIARKSKTFRPLRRLSREFTSHNSELIFWSNRLIQ